ncbi:MAG: SGNH/GDSL hydrolase family protein [Planctomycetota bacterium]
MSDAMTFVPANAPRLSWRGHVSLEPVGEGFKPWRIPFNDRRLFPGVAEKAESPAGVRLAFDTDAQTLQLRAELADNGSLLPDVCVGDEVVAMPPGETVALPGSGMRHVEVWLPQSGTATVHGVELPTDATLARPEDDARPIWLTYGSSITHCAQAKSPTRTWPARAARQAGLDLTCLGFGGQCHLDPMVARVIRDQPADYISICCGINIHGAGSMNSRSFPAAVIGTIEIIREGHPDTPLCLISPIYSPPREEVATTDLTLVSMRAGIREIVDLLRERGDERLFYVDGLDIFGPDSVPEDADMKTLMPDDLHPEDVAQPILAGNVVRHVFGGAFGMDVPRQ